MSQILINRLEYSSNFAMTGPCYGYIQQYGPHLSVGVTNIATAHPLKETSCYILHIDVGLRVSKTSRSKIDEQAFRFEHSSFQLL